MPGKGKKCIVCEKTRASCGKEGNRPTHCGKCKEQGMIDVISKMCEVCKVKNAVFGLEGGKHTHCSKCKTEDMIDVKNKKCIVCKKKQSTFGEKGGKATHCVDCKPETYIDLKSKICTVCKSKNASFGIPGKLLTHCGECKEEDMINLKCKWCITCKEKQPSFASKKGDMPTYCAKCKPDGYIDVRSRICIVCNKVHASYASKEGDPPTHCKTCKLDCYIDVKGNKCIKCKKLRASCALKRGDKASHCASCKPEGYTNVVSNICQFEDCDTIIQSDKYDGYCTWCFSHIFPEDPRVELIQKKSFELEVASKLLGKDSSFKHDKAMYIGECDCTSRRRVDFWKIIGNTILAIEVDENQHKSYEKDYEDIRYNDLFMVFSGKWVFIRFNPNNYRDKDGKIVRKDLNSKIDVLLLEIDKQVQRIMKEKNEDLLEIHRLFFDEEGIS